MTDKGIDNLKFGIIEQAAIDYVDLLAGFKSPTTDCNVDECRRFFRSQWFHSLCDLDPEQVINRLERKAKTIRGMKRVWLTSFQSVTIMTPGTARKQSHGTPMTVASGRRM